MDEVVEKASKEVGEIDVVVVNAGAYLFYPVSTKTQDASASGNVWANVYRCLDVEGLYRLYRR